MNDMLKLSGCTCEFCRPTPKTLQEQEAFRRERESKVTTLNIPYPYNSPLRLNEQGRLLMKCPDCNKKFEGSLSETGDKKELRLNGLVKKEDLPELIKNLVATFGEQEIALAWINKINSAGGLPSSDSSLDSYGPSPILSYMEDFEKGITVKEEKVMHAFARKDFEKGWEYAKCGDTNPLCQRTDTWSKVTCKSCLGLIEKEVPLPSWEPLPGTEGRTDFTNNYEPSKKEDNKDNSEKEETWRDRPSML